MCVRDCMHACERMYVARYLRVQERQSKCRCDGGKCSCFRQGKRAHTVQCYPLLTTNIDPKCIFNKCAFLTCYHDVIHVFCPVFQQSVRNNKILRVLFHSELLKDSFTCTARSTRQHFASSPSSPPRQPSTPTAIQRTRHSVNHSAKINTCIGPTRVHRYVIKINNSFSL